MCMKFKSTSKQVTIPIFIVLITLISSTQCLFKQEFGKDMILMGKNKLYAVKKYLKDVVRFGENIVHGPNTTEKSQQKIRREDDIAFKIHNAIIQPIKTYFEDDNPPTKRIAFPLANEDEIEGNIQNNNEKPYGVMLEALSSEFLEHVSRDKEFLKKLMSALLSVQGAKNISKRTTSSIKEKLILNKITDLRRLIEQIHMQSEKRVNDSHLSAFEENNHTVGNNGITKPNYLNYPNSEIVAELSSKSLQSTPSSSNEKFRLHNLSTELQRLAYQINGQGSDRHLKASEENVKDHTVGNSEVTEVTELNSLSYPNSNIGVELSSDKKDRSLATILSHQLRRLFSEDIKMKKKRREHNHISRGNVMDHTTSNNIRKWKHLKYAHTASKESKHTTKSFLNNLQNEIKMFSDQVNVRTEKLGHDKKTSISEDNMRDFTTSTKKITDLRRLINQNDHTVGNSGITKPNYLNHTNSEIVAELSSKSLLSTPSSSNEKFRLQNLSNKLQRLAYQFKEQGSDRHLAASEANLRDHTVGNSEVTELNSLSYPNSDIGAELSSDKKDRSLEKNLSLQLWRLFSEDIMKKKKRREHNHISSGNVMANTTSNNIRKWKHLKYSHTASKESKHTTKSFLNNLQNEIKMFSDQVNVRTEKFGHDKKTSISEDNMRDFTTSTEKITDLRRLINQIHMQSVKRVNDSHLSAFEENNHTVGNNGITKPNYVNHPNSEIVAELSSKSLQRIPSSSNEKFRLQNLSNELLRLAYQIKEQGSDRHLAESDENLRDHTVGNSEVTELNSLSYENSDIGAELRSDKKDQSLEKILSLQLRRLFNENIKKKTKRREHNHVSRGNVMDHTTSNNINKWKHLKYSHTASKESKHTTKSLLNNLQNEIKMFSDQVNVRTENFGHDKKTSISEDNMRDIEAPKGKKKVFISVFGFDV